MYIIMNMFVFGYCGDKNLFDIESFSGFRCRGEFLFFFCFLDLKFVVILSFI